MNQDHIRSVTLELSQANITDFNTNDYINSLINGGFNTIVCFSIGYLNGESYYNSKFIKKNPDLGNRDILDEISKLKNKHKFKFIAYLNTQFSDVANLNPKWAQRRINGKKTTQLNASTICPNSPYKELLLKSAKEIANNYNVDGFYFDEVSFQSWCNCNFCKKKFKAKTGNNIPLKINFKNPIFLKWMSWRENIIHDYMKKYYSELKKINKKYEIFFQSAFPISSTFIKMKNFQYVNPVGSRVPKEFVGFYRPSFYGQNIENNHEYSDTISIEPWRKIAGTPIWWPGLCTSYVNNINPKKNTLPLMELPHFPWSIINLPKDEIVFNIADVQANGGGTWYPMYSPDRKNLKYWKNFNEIFKKFNLIPKYKTREIDIGLLFSKNNAEKTNTNDSEDNYIDDFNNTVSLLKEIKVNFSTFSFETLYKMKKKPKIIIFINHEYFTKKEYSFFINYIQNGGKIISWGKNPIYLDNGNNVFKDEKFLKNIFGVKKDLTRPYFGYLNYNNNKENILSPTYGPNNFYDNLDAENIGYLFEGDSMFATPDITKLKPAIFSKKINKGKSILFSNNISLVWEKTKSISLIKTLKNIVFNVINSDYTFYSDSIGQFSFYLWKEKKSYLIWLTNHSGIEQSGFCNILKKVEINVPTNLKNVKVSNQFNKSNISIKKNKKNMKIIIQNLNIWECIEFKCK